MRTAICSVVLLASLSLASPALASKKLFVGGLAWGTTAERVERHLSRFGPILSTTVIAVDRDGRMSAEAIVEFENDRDADAAELALDGTIVGGQPISAKSREIVVVGSKVKEVIREAGLRSHRELVQAVSDRVHALLQEAIARAKANGRSTVRPHDL